MDLKLNDKRVFISGSTAGIGYAVARAFVAEGAAVLLNGRSKTSVKNAVQRLLNEFPEGRIDGLAANFKERVEIENLIDKLGVIDILINNVGIYTSQSFVATKDQDWYDMFEVNVMSGVRLSRALLPQMLKRNCGKIIFVSSECADLVPADLIAYSTTKLALHALSRGLAQLCTNSNVNVNVAMPGSTYTEGAEQFLSNVAASENITLHEASTNFFSKVRTSSIAKRFLTPEEIANSILYLSSDHSSAINGSVIKLDGGSVSGIM